MTIRFAKPEDCPALLEIYGQYINTSITFEYALPTEREFADRIALISSTYPYLVCEENNRIAGYAYAARHRDRAAYQWSAELSVYLDRSSTSKGLGRQLYTLLMDILELQGITNVYGGVTVPNEKSEAFHKALGFRILGSFHNVGFKDGEWRDVMWFEKAIGEYSPAPQPLVRIGDVPAEQLREIMSPFA
jgi:Sortase and related acyltransferases